MKNFSLTTENLSLPKAATPRARRVQVRWRDKGILDLTQGLFRCYLFPVYSPQGVPLTAESPVDHPHHNSITVSRDGMGVLDAPGDGVVLFTPVYHAFFKKAAAKRRGVVQSEMVLKDGRYFMDFDTLETQLTGREKIAVLCSPHNPGGRLWSAEEIRELAAFCQKHDLLLLSDEIHMDLAFPDAKHVPTAVAAPDSIDRLVVITAASKGFNLAGGETGFMIVPDPALREKLAPVQLEYGGTPNRFGMLMTRAAFTGGQDWSEAVRAYLAENFALWRDRISAIPGISVMDMPSTYLTWVDFAGTGMSPEETERRIRQDARIAQSPGADFGKGGENFHRFNIAMPRPRLNSPAKIR